MISTLARVEAHVFRVPIKDPVRTSFGTMTERAAVFVKAEDSDGARGWGEIWCNFPNAAAEHRALIFADIVAARALGKPFTAIPVVPRRLFSQSLFFTRIDSPLSGPQSLVGRRVGLNTYQTTLSVLAKGDLQHAHGLGDPDGVGDLDFAFAGEARSHNVLCHITTRVGG